MKFIGLLLRMAVAISMSGLVFWYHSEPFEAFLWFTWGFCGGMWLIWIERPTP